MQYNPLTTAIYMTGIAGINCELDHSRVIEVSVRKEPNPEGNLGCVQFDDRDDNFLQSIEGMNNRLTILSAGRAAVEVFPELAGSCPHAYRIDSQVAQSLAREIVIRSGAVVMPRLGSDSANRELVERTGEVLKAALARAKALASVRKALIEELANELLTEGSMTGERFDSRWTE